MTWITLLILASLSLAADDRIISLWIPNTDPQPLAGSIVAEQAGTTTYSINCPPGIDYNNCGMGPGLFLTTAQSSVEYLISEGKDDVYVPTALRYPMTWRSEPITHAGTSYNHVVCTSTDITGGLRTCTATVTGKSAKMPGTSSTTLSQGQATPLPVRITSGAAKTKSEATSPAMAGATATPTPTAGTSDGVGGQSGRLELTILVLACVAVQALAESL
ncbi:uncharacterized protein N7515_005994 [Penicillium bovifimosum]|uniref:Uncharacterized protein n=1 Tax=Penicillium bovifimosum TaxID=126998 RepID=A0A9W9GTT5_9EURO|nr:uncharacterized protein N7515_005994 [Penicillium bovifimosum]KAJ5129955.1 hypothetical protein N7515_005994 [Penicillium bovifimosum]